MIEVETSEAIRTVVFARPEKKNAFTRAMYESFLGALEDSAADAAVRVVLVRGAGGCFTAGNDLADFLHDPPRGEDAPVFRLLLALERFPKPLVAAVEGPAIGLGTTLLLHCDLAVAGEGAVFQLPFVNLGLVPEGGSTLLLPRLVGHAKASELLLLGERFSAAVAHGLGLVTDVVPDEQVGERARALAWAVAQRPPACVRLTKQLLREGLGDRVRAALHREGAQFVERLRSDEAREALAAFLERRPPDFSRFS
jgi:enoyl-CoA hydratase/carnithine racemase